MVERFVKTIIECEIPCEFNYPLVGWKNVVGIDIDPVTEELVPIYAPLPAPPEQMFGVFVDYVIRRSGVGKTFVYLLKDNGTRADFYTSVLFFTEGDALELLNKLLQKTIRRTVLKSWKLVNLLLNT